LSKLLERQVLTGKIKTLQSQGQSIVFTNGCFDLLHAGHVRYLTAARAEGDVLVVGLNSDKSVQTIKGPKRPLVTETYRAEMLAGLSAIDFITLFDESTPLETIRLISPNVLIKGADWAEDEIVGADLVKENGGRVVRIPMVADLSTSQLIERIVEQYR
jgi:D-glycero-beta-D-manno-heptose 1-phosphate adenylyltransferase